VDQQQHLSVLNISGTNGGGDFGANSAHPLENPTYFTNAVELWAQLIIPFAMIFCWILSQLKRQKKQNAQRVN
jgi:K+-transporting ATPase A subunit